MSAHGITPTGIALRLRRWVFGVVLVGVLAAGPAGARANITKFPWPRSEPNDLVPGPDGALWFDGATAGRDSTIGRVTMNGTIDRTFTAPGLDAYGQPTAAGPPQGLGFAPDGSMYYGTGGGGPLGYGHVTTAGEGGAVASQAFGDFVAGPGGNMWFVGKNQRTVGYVTPAGDVSVLAPNEGNGTPATGGDATAPTVGPDGNIWFVEIDGAIGRMTPAGELTEFPVDAAPTDITTGPGGALWFTSADFPSAVRRITTGGAISRVADFPGVTHAITTGANGNVWAAGGGQLPPALAGRPHNIVVLERITPAGVVTRYCDRSSLTAEAIHMALGSDGNIWFISTARDIDSQDFGRRSLTRITPDTPSNCAEPPQPGPRVAVTKPGRIKKTTLKESAAGDIRVLVKNPNGVAAHGDLKLSTRIFSSATKKRTSVLGRKRFNVPAHAVASVKLRLPRNARLYLKTHKSAKAEATLVLSAGGKSKTDVQTITIRA